MLTVNPTGAQPAALLLGVTHVMKFEPSGVLALSCDFNPFRAGRLFTISPGSCDAIPAVSSAVEGEFSPQDLCVYSSVWVGCVVFESSVWCVEQE